MLWTLEVTKEFIVVLRAVVDVVTHVVGVNTYPGVATTVVPRTRVGVAVIFVFVARAVVHIVTAQVNGQAVEQLVHAAKMCGGAMDCGLVT